MLMEIERLRND